ncbi:MAG: hypothetical protein ACTSO9_11425 [Candidatus Helarchaeota archaeon]
MAMLQKKPKEENEVEEKTQEFENELAELEAEADKLVESISKNTEIIKNKVKQIVKPKEIRRIEPKEKTKEIIEEEIIQRLIKTYKWAYKENLYPWMYWIPEKNKDLDSWLDEWGDFLFDWSREFIIHIADMYELATKRPFSALQDRDKALQLIFENLVKNSRFAKWINDEKTRLRIYWRSLDKWGDLLYDWAFLVGEQRLTLLDLREMGEQIAKGFETLPAKDLKEIIELLVKKKKAVWIDKRSFKLLFEM